MAKKIAGQTGRSVSAGGEMSVGSGCLSTGDYTAFLQSVQDEVAGRFAPKKALGMELSRIYELLSLYRRADRVSQCGSYLDFGVLPDGTKKLVKANFCRDRLCPMCNWRRSLKLYSQVSQVMDVFFFLRSLCEIVLGMICRLPFRLFFLVGVIYIMKCLFFGVRCMVLLGPWRLP